MARGQQRSGAMGRGHGEGPAALLCRVALPGLEGLLHRPSPAEGVKRDRFNQFRPLWPNLVWVLGPFQLSGLLLGVRARDTSGAGGERVVAPPPPPRQSIVLRPPNPAAGELGGGPPPRRRRPCPAPSERRRRTHRGPSSPRRCSGRAACAHSPLRRSPGGRGRLGAPAARGPGRRTAQPCGGSSGGFRRRSGGPGQAICRGRAWPLGELLVADCEAARRLSPAAVRRCPRSLCGGGRR